MPLFNGKPLELHNYTKKFSDDEEVFYYELTNEIFENYEDYYERVLSCGSMVWTCAITGKSQLTYQEALQSEQNALKNIKDFAPELRTPVLYLATLTQRKNFSEMADDIYNFVKDRYFVKESVLACFEESQWSYGQVLRVLLPQPDEVMKYCEEQNVKHPINYKPYPAALYSYEVQELLDNMDDDDEITIIRTQIVKFDSIKRIKGIYTKDKNRAYLKQFCEQRKNEGWKVKPQILAKYAIESLRYSDIFAGEIPDFYNINNKSMHSPKPPKPPKSSSKNEKLTQQSMKKFLVSKSAEDRNDSINKKTTPKKNANKEVMKDNEKARLSKKEQQMRARLEVSRKKREEKKNEREKLATFAKEWQRKREDLECEDLKELPQGCPVDCRVPNEMFGDFLMILEFFTCFEKTIKVANYFSKGLTFELLERALVECEIAGPLCDILQLLLSALFELQEQEDDEIKHRKAAPTISLDESADLDAQGAVKLATLAARWSKTHHNVPLPELHMDAVTVTDILRLHLLSSGGRAGEHSAKWRFQERGGYCSTDDPGMEFRMNEPQILKFLAVNPVAALEIQDKIKVINCLTSQILTYATIRDVMEEGLDKVTNGRKELRNTRAADAKKERERLKEKKMAKEKGLDDESIDQEEVRQQGEFEMKKAEYCKRWEELQEAAMAFQLAPLGEDRGHRRYWLFSSVAGLFVEDDERWPGHCLAQPTIVNKTAVHDEDTMTYIRNLFEAGRNSTGSDKENEFEKNETVGSPKKKLLGEMNGMSISPPEGKSPVKLNGTNNIGCTGQQETCSIHNTSIERTRWLFYYRDEEIDELIKALNKRGYREHALRHTLVTEKNRVLKHVRKCPVQNLNRFVPIITEQVPNKIGTRRKDAYDDPNLGHTVGTAPLEILEGVLRTFILDIELKVDSGRLGSLKVADRIAWRAAIENMSYECQDQNLTWPTKMKKDREVEEREESSSRPGSPCSIHSNSDSVDEPTKLEQNSTVVDLAMAVLQIARSVEAKYLKKPLPYEKERPFRLTALERWEYSLMRSTSFSQVYLHLTSLENSITWNKSVLNARCKICRRGRDDINMLLCDGCDRGFHLYCLKPKLTSIPKGDWFCTTCRPKEKTPMTKSRRRRFLEEDDEEVSSDDSESEDEPLVKRRTKRGRDNSIDETRSKRHKAS